MGRRSRQPHLGVATLAAYAADPAGFHARQGKAADAKAAAYGRRVHRRAGAAPASPAAQALAWLVFALVAAAFAAWWLVGL